MRIQRAARRTVAALFTIGLLATGPATGAAARAASCDPSGWPTVHSPNVGRSHNELLGVALVDDDELWAAGWYERAASRVSAPLLLHREGDGWEHVPMPAGSIGTLSSVDASSSEDVWAVGILLNDEQGGDAVALHRDGDTWTFEDVPKPQPGPGVSTVFTDVVALAPDDAWAVGYWSPVVDAPPSPLIEHWDGDGWEVVASPELGTWSELHGIAAVGPDDIWAVGNTEVQVGEHFTERALFEHWDGDSWTVVPTPFVARLKPFTLGAVDVRSPTDAWAVGNISTRRSVDTIAFHWDGLAWTHVPTPNPSDEYQALAGVAIGARGRAWAVGTVFDESDDRDETLVVRWDGARWSRKRSANRSAGNSLHDVAALPGRQVAVGSFWKHGGDGPQRTLVLDRCPTSGAARTG